MSGGSRRDEELEASCVQKVAEGGRKGSHAGYPQFQKENLELILSSHPAMVELQQGFYGFDFKTLASHHGYRIRQLHPKSGG